MFDTAELLALIRQECRAPGVSASSPTGLTDTDILRLANYELFSSLVLELLKTHEDYLVRDTDQALTVGTATYQIPTRSILRKLRQLVYVDSSGAEFDVVPLTDRNNLKPSNQGRPTQYRFLDVEHVKLYPTPDKADTLRFTTYRRPNKLVANTTGASGNVATVSSKDSTHVNLNAAHPTAWAAGTTLDFISATEPFTAYAEDVIISNLTSTQLTMSGGTPAAVTAAPVADIYVCLAGEAPFLQLPVEYFHVLGTRVAARILKGGVDEAARQDAVAEATDITERLVQATESRNDGQPGYVKHRTWGR